MDGKPRIVSQEYLGTAEEVMAKLAGGGAGEPVRSQHKRFGDLAAVWSVLQRLGVAEVIDTVAPRRADAAVSVGTYIALATANRVVAPCSKLAFADWWSGTAGSRWVKTPAGALDHRRFWDAMDHLDTEALRSIETELGRRMVTEFGVDVSALALDMTMFATYIDSANDRAPIAQRGKAKQKRIDLRLVGLALVVTRDGGVPVESHAYPGDRPDVTQFPMIIDALLTRYRASACSVRFVDRGVRRRAELGRLRRPRRRVRAPVRRTIAPVRPSRPGRDTAENLRRRRCRPLPRPELRGHRGDRVGGHTARGADPFPDPARRPVPRLRSNPGQSPGNV